MARNTQPEVIELNYEFEKFSEDTRLILEEIRNEQKQQQKRIQEMEKKLSTLPDTAEVNPAELRQELINGIRLLGEKVSSALNQMSERFEKYSIEINEKITRLESLPKEVIKESDQQFGKLKETELLEESDFEVVPRDAINRLMDLNKRQALAVKKYLDEREVQLNDFEKKMKQNEEKISNFHKLVAKKVNQNFIITLAIIAIVILVLGLISIF